MYIILYMLSLGDWVKHCYSVCMQRMSSSSVCVCIGYTMNTVLMDDDICGVIVAVSLGNPVLEPQR